MDIANPPSSSVSMLDLFDVSLYVCNFAYDFSIPDTTTKFVENVAITLKIMFTMQRDVMRLANATIAVRGSELNSLENAFNIQGRSYESNPRLDYVYLLYVSKRFCLKIAPPLLWLIDNDNEVYLPQTFLFPVDPRHWSLPPLL